MVDNEPTYEELLAHCRNLEGQLHRLAPEVHQDHSEFRYGAMLDATTDGFWLVDGRGRLLDVNHAYERMSGYSRAELLGFGVADLEAVDSPSDIEERTRRIQEQGADRFTTKHRTKSDEILDVEVSISYWSSPDRFVVFIRDLRQLKRAERALEESERRYRLLFDAMASGFAVHEMILDASGAPVDYRFVQVNPAFEELTGFSARDLVGRTVLKVMPETEFSWIERYGEVARTGETIHFESYSGALGRWFDVVAYRPEPGRFATLFTDVTERHQNQALIERQNAQILLAQEIGRLGYWSYRPATGELVWSDLASEIMGWEPSLRVSGLKEVARYVEDEDCERFMGCIEGAMQGKPFDAELRVTRPEDAVAYVALRGRPQLGSDGTVEEIFGVVQDVTQSKQIASSLEEALARQRAIVRAANVGLWDWDLASNTVHYSAEWKRQIGYEDDEIGDTFEEWESRVHPDDLAQTVERIEHMVAQRAPQYQTEFRFRHKDNSYRHILAQASVVVGPTGEPLQVIGSHIDVTDSKKQEAALRESEELFRSFVENASDIVHALTPDGIFTYLSPNWADYVGWSSADAIGRPFDEFVHPDDVPVCRAFLNKVVQMGRQEQGVEYRVRHRDGGYRWHMSNGSPLLDDNGRVVSYVGIARDMTERKAADDRLSETLRDLEMAQRLADIGNWLFDPVVGVAEWSNQMYEIFEIPREQGVPSIEQFGMLFREAHFELFAKSHEDAVAHGVAFDVVLRADLPSGTSKWLHAIGMPESEPGPAGYMTRGTVQDITERYQAEQRQERLQEQLLQAQKMESVGRLAGGVAHDFNNMLGVILGHLELAKEELSPDEPLYDLVQVESAAQRSADFTRQLLAFARRQPVKPVSLDINETLVGMLKMLKRLIGEDIELHWEPGKDLWRILVDPTQIDQILANLSVNARDAIGRHGQITISTCNVTIPPEEGNKESALYTPGDYVQLSVSDNGCGMDAETIEGIFEPFFTTKAQGEGTGLGLATVYGIVQQNGGHISVESVVDEGTTFRILLPRSLDHAVETTGEGSADAIRGNGELVLLVEDEPSILELTRRILTSLGYKVLAMSSPGEALAAATANDVSIRLLVTDMVMPEMNGVALAKRIQEVHPGVAVLYMSGYSADVMAQQGLSLEGLALLPKPFTRRQLAENVRASLDRGRASAR